MAKIVSEKREFVVPTLPTSTAPSDKEPQNSLLATLLGVALTAIFMVGAVAMVVLAFRS
jgi:hypothetical protein